MKEILEKLNKIEAKLEKPIMTSGKPSIVNIEMPSANIEYPDGGHILPKSCKRFLIQCRDGTAFRIAFEKDKVASSNPPYFTVVREVPYWEDNLNLEEDVILYFACGSASKVLEIIQWS